MRARGMEAMFRRTSFTAFMMKIAKHTVPTVEYTLRGENGQVLDSTDGRGALVYLHGVGGVIPGLESALEGKAAGDRIAVSIPPQQAFGQHDPKLVLAVARNSFSGVDQIRVGMQFRAQTTAGPILNSGVRRPG